MGEFAFFIYVTIVVLITALAGIIMGKFKQPVMIGYILAGIITGPSCLSLISSQEQIHIYSELGIILLLFVIGLELNIKSFLKMWKIPTFFTTIQVTVSTILAYGLATFLSLPTYAVLLIAFCACLSSTAAIVKCLECMGELKTDVGYISIGILVSQDIAVVPMMLVIKECGQPFGISIIAKLLVAIGLVVILIKYLGRKEKIILPTSKIATSTDLIPIITLAIIFAAAAIVQLCGLSAAYGAFLVGLFIGNTQERQNILNNIKPLQDLLLMSFFLSVGLMFNLQFLLQNFFTVLFGLMLITIWKIIFNTVVLRIFNINFAKSTAIGIILAQLGEFSLVLASFARQSHIIGGYGQKLIICITALSLAMSPLFIKLSSKVLNLSFIGDNSIKSIIKVIFSGKFSNLVKKLLDDSKEVFVNKIGSKPSLVAQTEQNISQTSETTYNTADINDSSNSDNLDLKDQADINQSQISETTYNNADVNDHSNSDNLDLNEQDNINQSQTSEITYNDSDTNDSSNNDNLDINEQNDINQSQQPEVENSVISGNIDINDLDSSSNNLGTDHLTETQVNEQIDSANNNDDIKDTNNEKSDNSKSNID